MPDSASPVADRDRDVFVTSFEATFKFVHGRRTRSARGALWSVFLGSELIEHYEDPEDAIELARKISAKSDRPAWISRDAVTFEIIK